MAPEWIIIFCAFCAFLWLIISPRPLPHYLPPRSLIFLLPGLFLLSFPSLTAGNGGNRPNIVFLFTDDQAYDTLGCYGNPNVKTPNIDRLGNEGVIFDRHYDTTAICMASRANVMSGLYEYRSGTNFMHGPMARKLWQKSYPPLLREAGYRTGFGGKFGFAVVDDPRKGGKENDYKHLPVDDFDFWVGGVGQTSYQTDRNKYLARFADRFPHSTRAYGAAGQDNRSGHRPALGHEQVVGRNRQHGQQASRQNNDQVLAAVFRRSRRRAHRAHQFVHAGQSHDGGDSVYRD